MHRLSWLPLAVVGTVSLVACAAKPPSSDAAAFSAQDSAAVAASAELWRTSSLARDWDKFGSTISSDVVMFPPNSPPTVGHEASMAYIKAFPTITKFEINVDELTGKQDMAYDRGHFTLTAKLPDGKEINDQGSFMSVFRRQADGSWKHSRVMWHSDLPMPAPAPAPAKR